MSNIDVDKMDRSELLELRDLVAARLKEFRPYRIKERYVRCNNFDCCPN